MGRRLARSGALVVVALSACALALMACAGCASNSVDTRSTIPSASIMPDSAFENTPTIPVAGKVEPPASGAYLGVYVPPAPFEMDKLDSFTTKAGKNVSIVMWYQPWAQSNRSQFDAGACVAVMRRGKVPMITWEPWDPGTNSNNAQNPGTQPDFQLRDINSGVYDDYIRTWAREIRALGGPVMLRPMHEMNGNWYPWSGTTNDNRPEEFVLAWRRIHDIFAAERATNVTWVWSINHESVPATAENSYSAYYPGDDYVDWTAISGFNWGTSRSDTTWETYAHWYTRPLAYLKTLGKPIVLAEFGSVEQGGDKAAWIADAYRRIRTNHDIDAVIYFDSLEVGANTHQDWRVDTSPGSVLAFRKAIASGYFVTGPPAALSSWANSLRVEAWQYLSTLLPTY